MLLVGELVADRVERPVALADRAPRQVHAERREQAIVEQPRQRPPLDPFGEHAEQIVGGVRIGPVLARAEAEPQPAAGRESGASPGRPETWSSSCWTLIGVSTGHCAPGISSRTSAPRLSFPSAAKLVEHDRGHRLGDRADLEQGRRPDRRTRFRVGKAGVDHGRETVGKRHRKGQRRQARSTSGALRRKPVSPPAPAPGPPAARPRAPASLVPRSPARPPRR